MKERKGKRKGKGKGKRKGKGRKAFQPQVLSFVWLFFSLLDILTHSFADFLSKASVYKTTRVVDNHKISFVFLTLFLFLFKSIYSMS